VAQFFIHRPIFAWVIALFILVIGSVSITQLPIAQLLLWQAGVPLSTAPQVLPQVPQFFRSLLLLVSQLVTAPP
jgi:uncharacterized membrane protein